MMAVRQAIPPRAPKKSNKFNKIKKKDDKKGKEKTPDKVTKPKKVNKVLLVEQEIKFALKLAGNDKKASDKVLRSLKKWLTYRSASTMDFTEYDFVRLWKGLFYCVWMSDKPLVQEDLCESIAGLFECFGINNMATSCLFYKCFLLIMAQNWIGIDQHRIDKFLMLVRRVTRAIFKCAKEQKWSTAGMELITEALSGKKGLLTADPPKEIRNSLGLQMHLSDCWMEEISKISEGNLSSEALTELCRPFAQYLSYGDEPRLSSSIVKNIFTHLIRQTDLGMDYQDKLLAWRNAGYPGGNIDSMEKVVLSDEEIEEEEIPETEDEPKIAKALDPRAGFVDAVLPQLPVDGEMIASLLRSMVSDPRSTSNNRNKLKSLSQYFETLASGVYPYKAKDIVLPTDARFKLPKAAKAAQELLDYERKCADQYDEDDMKGLNKRQRRKLLMAQKKKMESADADSDNDEEESSTPAKKQKKNMLDSDGWDVEDIPETSENTSLDSSKSASLKTHPLKHNRDKNRKVKTTIKKSNKSDNNSTPINRKGKNKIEAGNKSSDTVPNLTNGVSKENSISPMKNIEDRGTSKSIKKTKLNKSSMTTPLGNSQQKNLDDSRMAMSQGKQKKSADNATLGELKKKNVSPTMTPKNKQKKALSSPSGAGQKKLDTSEIPSPIIKQKKSSPVLSVVQQKMLENSDMITPQKKHKKLNLTNGDVSTYVTPTSNNAVPKSAIKEFKAKNRDTSTPISSKKNKKNDTIKSPIDDKQKPISTESVTKKQPSESTPKSKPAKTIAVTPLSNIIPKDVNSAKKSTKKTPNKMMSETEIFIPNRVNSLKNNSKRLNSSDSGLLKEKKNRLNGNVSMDSGSPGNKKVMIALKKNTAQSVMDFFKSVKQSPEIPFDGGKKPLKTSLKPNSIPSPINPFYKKKLKLNF